MDRINEGKFYIHINVTFHTLVDLDLLDYFILILLLFPVNG